MRPIYPIFILLVSASCLFGEPANPGGLEFFEKKVRPLLVEHCYKCHSSESEKVKGGLRVDTREGLLKGGEHGPAIVPGDPEKSLLIKAVRYEDEDLQMPPKTRLSAEQVGDLATWIQLGAPDPREAGTHKITRPKEEHWAFQKPKRAKLPEVKDSSWIKTPLDAFILEKLEQAGLRPAPPADKRTLIRRAYYDLTGLPPTADEVAAFEEDNSPEAFAREVERLLGSHHYGERWGRHWLDVARYADTKGYVYTDREEGQFVHSHVYRDWVVNAFNRDLPYDEFLKAQIAGDQLPPGEGIESPLAGLGFLSVGRRFLGVTHDIIDDRIDVLTKATQALTVSCARCHDHKFDPVPIEDYYSLYGVFAASTERTVCLEPNPKPSRAYEDFKKGYDERVEKLKSTFQKKKDELLARVRKQTPEYLAAVLEADKLPTEEFYEIRGPDDLNPVIVRQWQAYLEHAGQSFHPVLAVWHAFSKIPNAEFAQRAAATWQQLTNQHGPEINPLVLKAFALKIPESMKEVAKVYGALFKEANEKQLAQAKETKQGDPAAGGELSREEKNILEVLYAADSPVSIPPGSVWDIEWFFPEGDRVEFGRLQSEIDRWIIKSPGAPKFSVILEDRPSSRNPRVFRRGNPATKGEEVPRQYLAVIEGEKRKPFQRGSGRLEMANAIASSENPLTARVMVNRIWAHHFGEGLVRTMNDFGTRSEPPSHPELLDWLANYFVEKGWSIKQMHRLILLSNSYQQSPINPEAAKARSLDPENKLLWKASRHRLEFEELRDSLLVVSGAMDYTAGGKPVPLFGKDEAKRRSLYGFIDRQFLPGVFRVFDFPNPDLPSGQRSLTTVPQQALYLMNNRFLVERARQLAALAEAESSDPAARVRVLHRRALQREPLPEELQSGLDFIRAAEKLPLPEPPAPPPPSAWSYGYGELKNGKEVVFTPLPHFTDGSWQGGPNWPDEKLGWVRLTAEGGHAGNDLKHAAIRRWTAPANGKLTISASLEHNRMEGDGIHAILVSSRQSVLGEWNVHNSKAKTDFDSIPVQKGESMDFMVDIRTGLNNDDFIWAPKLKLVVDPGISYDKTEWNAKKEFAGPPDPLPTPLKPWEAYAQAILISNEFVFVD